MMQNQPNLFIVGAPKCGTTAWVEYLSGHPDICFSSSKEPHYFNTDFPGFRWSYSLEQYLEYFKGCGGAKVIGEASVQYLYSEEAAKNIAKFSPEAKILIFLRSPGAFIRSYHNQMLINTDEDEPQLRKAWELSGERHGDSLPKGCREERFLDYKKVGLFSEQVERYLRYFHHDHVKVVFFEDWVVSPRDTYLEIMDFLGINDDSRTDFAQVHGAKQVVNWRLHQMTQRPPTGGKLVLSAIRKIPGMKGFRPARLIRSLNIRSGYKQERDKELEKEIDHFFAEDQLKLHASLEKVSCGF